LMRGFKLQTEQYGTQNMDKCCFIGARSVVAKDVGFDVGIALIRYIMARHYKVHYSDIRNPLWGDSVSPDHSSAPDAIVFQRRIVRQDGSSEITDRSTFFLYTSFSAPRSLGDFATWFADNVFLESGFYNNNLASTSSGADPRGALGPYSHFSGLPGQYIQVKAAVTLCCLVAAQITCGGLIAAL